MMIKPVAVSLLLGVVGLGSCGILPVEEPKPYVTDQSDRIRQKSGTIHGGENGFVLYSDRDKTAAQNAGQPPAEVEPFAAETFASPVGPTGGGALAANAYLWQASLESLDFLPLVQADSSGGVIISDWYAPPETPEERFKVTVYLYDQTLRADALKVSVFRQTNGENGWVDAAVDKSTAFGLEDNILKRARELRLAENG